MNAAARPFARVHYAYIQASRWRTYEYHLCVLVVGSVAVGEWLSVN